MNRQYLLIGNVMLLNLLIAVFTSVFEEVHENSNDVWKWEMYRLVEEYDKVKTEIITIHHT